MKTTITICETCKREGWESRNTEITDGQLFAEMIEAVAATEDQVETRRQSCLMGCQHGCNIAVQAEGKLNYVLGRFEPDQVSAEALVEYARLHAESALGQVPFKQWPQGVKGHFVARIPPLKDQEA